MVLARPCPGKLDQIIAAVGKVKRQAHGRFDDDRLRSSIGDRRGTHDDVLMGENRIPQRQQAPRGRVTEIHRQRVGVVAIIVEGAGHSRQPRHALFGGEPLVAELRGPTSVRLPYDEGGGTEIAVSP